MGRRPGARDPAVPPLFQEMTLPDLQHLLAIDRRAMLIPDPARLAARPLP
jgi:hypothetical protein